jgi:hypothetical protein
MPVLGHERRFHRVRDESGLPPTSERLRQRSEPTLRANCYNYAHDRITNTFAQLGRATGHQATIMACANVTAGATSDGLHSVPNFGGTLTKEQDVALVVWPTVDYYWYRQDNVGCWVAQARSDRGAQCG